MQKNWEFVVIPVKDLTWSTGTKCHLEGSFYLFVKQEIIFNVMKL